ncbi:integral membrane [Emericellopsis cladophorae]|uniref:Integral membrane n=1 Tax=Emericellopsis cladophorae TaxID=2686198 RepID=A0A9P9Y5G3_9HYPO|nr:integral membrane [Emericellopsis cladophorae]KAI6783928.1 integral membrane [Emericellopsis cladophorae]
MESRQTEVWVVLFVTFAAATIITVLRLLSRRLKRISLSWDDYFALCGFAISIGWVIIIPYWVNHGLGLHIEDVMATQNKTLGDALFQSKLLLFIAELFYAFGLFFAKVSMLSLYWRMFSVTNIRLPIQILFGCSLVWITFRIFMGIFHCIPVQAFWDSSAGGYCAIEDKKFFFGTTLVHAAIDIAILILPMWQISQLQLPLLQKAGIMVMFTFGFFICAAAIRLIVAARVFDDHSPDLTWNICDIVIWATVEVNLINVSASLPTIRPACTFIFTCTHPRTRTEATSGSYPNTEPRSRTKHSIRLDPMTKSSPNDESSSTHQLADSDDGGGRGSVSDFESHAIDRLRPSGHKYTSTVTGQSGMGGSSRSNLDGILVKNETTVHVSKH